MEAGGPRVAVDVALRMARALRRMRELLFQERAVGAEISMAAQRSPRKARDCREAKRVSNSARWARWPVFWCSMDSTMAANPSCSLRGGSTTMSRLIASLVIASRVAPAPAILSGDWWVLYPSALTRRAIKPYRRAWRLVHEAHSGRGLSGSPDVALDPVPLSATRCGGIVVARSSPAAGRDVVVLLCPRSSARGFCCALGRSGAPGGPWYFLTAVPVPVGGPVRQRLLFVIVSSLSMEHATRNSIICELSAVS